MKSNMSQAKCKRMANNTGRNMFVVPSVTQQ
jgi:hypothetical protein